MDECEENTDNCDVHARCINTNGGFRCRCLKNYRGSGVEGDCYSKLVVVLVVVVVVVVDVVIIIIIIIMLSVLSTETEFINDRDVDC